MTATSLLSRLDEHTDRLGDLLTVLANEPRALPSGYGELLDELVESLDGLRDAIAHAVRDAAHTAPGVDPSPSPSTDVPPSTGARLHYGSLVARIVDRVPALVPVGSVVAVVTRGDAALLGFVGVEGRHYPQDARGTWAGFHPADDAHALDLLAEVQQRGADHLLVPAPSAWWFEHYAGWRRHLDATARLVERDDDLTLYELGRDTAAAPPDAARRQYDRQVRLFLELAEALLPHGSLVAVVTRGDDAFLATRAVQARPFPADDHGVYAGHPADDADALAALARARARRGATHLAIPAPLRWWDDAYPGFVAALRRRHRLLADRRQAGSFFELDPPPPATDSE